MSRLGRWTAFAFLIAAGCGGSGERDTTSEPPAAASLGPFLFNDVTRESGIDFVHSHGGSGRRYLVESMVGGCAFLDYDGDGWLDVFIAQGAPLPGTRPGGPLRSALYRNRGGPASGYPTFTDVTAGSGLDGEIYGIGAAVGDYDNDGRADLYLTALGGNRLFRNESEPAGPPRFRDVTAAAGVAAKDLSTGAAWVDYDRDGWTDLFVCRYTDYTVGREPTCHTKRGLRVYCDVLVFPGAHPLLYRNRGDGTFEDVSRASGVNRFKARSLGIAAADYRDSGLPDLFVANDQNPNFLFLNQGNGTFREQAKRAGVALGQSGKAFAGMGVDCGDVENDGRMDLVVTNFEFEPNSLYRNEGRGLFSDATYRSGVGRPSHDYLGWGCRFADFDMDGLVDLFVVNGHIYDDVDSAGRQYPYEQSCLVFRNTGGGSFDNVSALCGGFFAKKQVGRGAAFGDYDNDGDTDVLIAVNNGPAILARNDSPKRYEFVRLALVGAGRRAHTAGGSRGCNAEGFGARVRVVANGMTQTQFVRSGTSYLSDHDHRPLFGIGKETQAAVTIRWPCGAEQSATVRAGETTPVEERGCRVN